MEIRYTERLIVDILLLQEAYIEAKQNKHKDVEDIEELYHLFVPERITKVVSEQRDSFKDAKSIIKYLRGRWGKIHEELVRSSWQR